MNTLPWRFLPVVLMLCSCSSNKTIGSRYVKSERVSAQSGGTLTIAASDSKELAGTSLQVPAGALSKDEEITLELGSSAITSGDDRAAGEVAIFGPSGLHFTTPATLTLPFTLSEGETTDRLFIQVEEENGDRLFIDGSQLAIDETQHTVSFPVQGFTSFQPGLRAPCMSNRNCSAGQACVRGVCQPHASMCSSTTQCPMGQVCEAGVCKSTSACGASGMSCPMGQVCQSGACVTLRTDAGTCGFATCRACMANSDCSAGQPCVGGWCQPHVAMCSASSQCQMGYECVGGACQARSMGDSGVTGCGASGHVCPMGQGCVSGTCSTLNVDAGMSGCGTAGVLCPMGQICQSGMCVMPPSTDAGTCGFAVCRACMANADCSAGQPCVGGWCQPHVAMCTSSSQCQMGYECTAGACRPRSTGDSGVMGCGASGLVCAMGQVCVSGVCR